MINPGEKIQRFFFKSGLIVMDDLLRWKNTKIFLKKNLFVMSIIILYELCNEKLGRIDEFYSCFGDVIGKDPGSLDSVENVI